MEVKKVKKRSREAVECNTACRLWHYKIQSLSKKGTLQ